MENTAWKISAQWTPAVEGLIHFQVSGHTFLAAKTKEEMYLHDLMWKEEGQPEALGKAQLSLVLKIKEPFLWGLTKRTLFN